MNPNNFAFLPVLLFLFVAPLTAQEQAVLLPSPNIKQLRLADEGLNANRFAAAINLAPALRRPNGAYEKKGDSYTWAKTFTVPGAYGLGFLVAELQLPPGATLHLSNATTTSEPLTQADASTENRFHTGFLPGETVTITYRGPLPETEPFALQRIDHVYRPELFKTGLEKDFGDADDCQVNANCPAGDDWEQEKSGTARIRLIVEEGVGWCSGNLINNTANDGRPLLLTGFHCMDGFTPLYDMWALNFGYAGAGCDDPATEPAPAVSYLGVRQLAGRQESDFLLLEITDPSFVNTSHYFAGWDRSDGNVTGVVTHLHHPQGDVMKIGQTGSDGMEILGNFITWNSDVVTPARHHFTLDYALGSFEPGSSGSAFFDRNHRIRGQLNGGNASCPGVSEAFVGRLFMSWDQGDNVFENLQSWLDPAATGAITHDGLTTATKKFVGGFAVLDNKPLSGVKIAFNWANGASDTAMTNENGFYRIERPTMITGFTMEPSYTPDSPNDIGVNVGDIIAIRRHILTLDTLSTFQQLAADVNGSGTVRVSDITAIIRVILNVADWRGRPNYLVIPVGFPLEPLPANVSDPVGIAINEPFEHELIIDFRVLKTGDVQ